MVDSQNAGIIFLTRQRVRHRRAWPYRGSGRGCRPYHSFCIVTSRRFPCFQAGVQKKGLAFVTPSANDLAARLQSTSMLTAYRYQMAGRRRGERASLVEPPSGAFSIRVGFPQNQMTHRSWGWHISTTKTNPADDRVPNYSPRTRRGGLLQTLRGCRNFCASKLARVPFARNTAQLTSF
jgi:hypothetical protein